MKRNCLIVSLALTALLAAFGASANAPRPVNQPGINAADELPYAPDRVLIQIRSSSMNQSVARLQPQTASSSTTLGIASLDAVGAQVGAVGVARMFMQPANVVEATRLGIDRWVVVKLAPGADVQTAVSAYAADPNVERASPDLRFYPQVVPTDPTYTDHWGHNNTGQLPSYDANSNEHFGPLVGDVGFDANAESGWDSSVGFGDPSVIIGIVDSGVDYSHPDLNVVPGFDFGDWDNDPADTSARPGHGTACAGIAAGKANNGLGACGAAPGCSIMPLKVADSAGNYFVSAIAVAIVWAADNGADILSISLGVPGVSSMFGIDEAIVYATGAGVTILAAAANANESPIDYPAAHPDVIAVGAAAPCEGRKRSGSDEDDAWPNSPDPNGVTCDNQFWWGSSFGPAIQDHAGAIDILAPTILVTTDIQGPGGYAPGDYYWYFNGTSCATPYAAGVAALIKSKNPGLAPWQISAQLTSTAQDVINVESGAGWDRYSGYGMVDMAAALACSAPPIALVKNFAANGNTANCLSVSVPDIDDGSYDPNGLGDIASLVITHVDGAPVGNQYSVEFCGDGFHTVRLAITDFCGNVASADAQVEIINSPPVAYAKRRIANADQNCCLVVHVSDIDDGSSDPDGADDIKSLCITDVDGTAVACADSVTVCGEGLHTVSLTITDWSDKTSTATADVTIIDGTPPDIDVVLDRNVLWPPNHKLVEVCADITATDNCDADPVVALVAVWSDEPDNDKGDGNTVDDIQNEDLDTEDACISLRAERMAGGDGRTYTIVFSATDHSGNASYDTVTVDCPHDMSANALGSTGFVADGTALAPGATHVALFVLGAPDLDVDRIDAGNIYLGNTAGVVKAHETRHVDINDDHLTDLAVLFDTEHAVGLEAIDGLLVAPDLDGAIDRRQIDDGPIGMHFATLDGTNYLVGNIYGLGVPVAMPAVTDKKTITPEQETLAPVGAPVTSGKVTALGSIHPNPFNPQTTVNFSLATPERVRVSIYDARGSIVRRLVDEALSAGDHQVRWDGMNDAGEGATSGVYFVRMVAGSHKEVRKIVMLK